MTIVPTTQMLDAGGNVIRTSLIGADPRVIANNTFAAMDALRPAEPAPTPTVTMPWDIPGPFAKHAETAKYSKMLWDLGSDRPGNWQNLMASYMVFRVAQSGTVPYTIAAGTNGNMAGQQIPFRSDWNPPSHSDKQIIVMMTDGSTIEMWHGAPNHTTKTITADRCSKIPPNTMQHNSRGVGIPYHHMLVTDAEITSGVIKHALSHRVNRPKSGEAWYPASKVENHEDSVPDGIPEGARFVASGLTATRIDAWAIKYLRPQGAAMEKLGRGLAEALKTYGWFITDNGSGYGAFDVQNWESWSPSNPLLTLAKSNYTAINNMLDNLMLPTDIMLAVETGPRIYKPKV
jgi:hypothetical protein